ncbi:hypothetical protein Ahy_B09g095655 isoform A [Arachis hypogaea]|uniref:Aminotransferase-like plant mobile domain-containing protein n=1 Tax=Arachis hypogaea TaxID=3818 RepID=A0A444XFK1_ARAHY|nr:hypothetical protein Ahy_B09g095655 isoform A [Arachis hypogaea]
MILHDRILPYLDRANLLHVARLNDYWFKLDEPLDVAYQFGLPIDGHAVSGCDCIDDFTVSFSWFQNKFRVLPAHALEETVQIYARDYIMMLLSTALFTDKSGARVHLRWLPYVADLDGLGKYSWASATLSWLYRCLCRVANRNVKNLSGPLSLLQSWIFWCFSAFRPRGFDAILWPLAARWGRFLPSSDEKGPRVIATRHRLDRLTGDNFIWMPYSNLEVIQVVHPDILRPDHTLLWKSTTALIYFVAIEWHQVDRVLSQLGGVQHIPEPAINIDFLLSKDGRGPTR